MAKYMRCLDMIGFRCLRCSKYIKSENGFASHSAWHKKKESKLSTQLKLEVPSLVWYECDECGDPLKDKAERDKHHVKYPSHLQYRVMKNED